MVKVRYLGIGNPKVVFDGLKAYRDRLLALQAKCRPFGPDFTRLYEAQKALDAAAAHFTGDPDFFALKPEQNRNPVNTEAPRPYEPRPM